MGVLAHSFKLSSSLRLNKSTKCDGSKIDGVPVKGSKMVYNPALLIKLGLRQPAALRSEDRSPVEALYTGHIASKQQCGSWVSHHFSMSMERYVLQKAMTEKWNTRVIACVIASQWSSTPKQTNEKKVSCWKGSSEAGQVECALLESPHKTQLAQITRKRENGKSDTDQKEYMC